MKKEMSCLKYLIIIAVIIILLVLVSFFSVTEDDVIKSNEISSLKFFKNFLEFFGFTKQIQQAFDADSKVYGYCGYKQIADNPEKINGPCYSKDKKIPNYGCDRCLFCDTTKPPVNLPQPAPNTPVSLYDGTCQLRKAGDKGFCGDCCNCDKNGKCIQECSNDGNKCKFPDNSDGICRASQGGCIKALKRGDSCNPDDDKCDICLKCNPKVNQCNYVKYGTQEDLCNANNWNGYPTTGNAFCSDKGECLVDFSLSNGASCSRKDYNIPECIPDSAIIWCAPCFNCESKKCKPIVVLGSGYKKQAYRCDLDYPGGTNHQCVLDGITSAKCVNGPQPGEVCIKSVQACPACYVCDNNPLTPSDPVAKCIPFTIGQQLGGPQLGVCDIMYYNGNLIHQDNIFGQKWTCENNVCKNID